MKAEGIIQANFAQKMGIWLSGLNRSEKLKEHIRMLDWVLNDKVAFRDIEEIIKSETGID